MVDFDPTLYDRRPIRIDKQSQWIQCDFEVPESVRETLTIAQLRQCHGRFVVGLDVMPAIGHEFVYPVSDNCPSFVWEVVKVRSYPHRYKSKQPWIVSQVVITFVEVFS